jgi:hypothetical protein
MVQVAELIVRRLRATWFGSVLALFWLVGLIAAPLARHCIAIAAVQGGPSGVFCGWTPALEDLTGLGLAVLLVFVAVIVTVPLAFPRCSVLLTVGLGSAAVVVVASLGSLDGGWYETLSELGLDITNEARSGLLFLLPASLVWIVAALRTRAGRPNTQ